jgi:hypothetical protein
MAPVGAPTTATTMAATFVAVSPSNEMVPERLHESDGQSMVPDAKRVFTEQG